MILAVSFEDTIIDLQGPFTIDDVTNAQWTWDNNTIPNPVLTCPGLSFIGGSKGKQPASTYSKDFYLQHPHTIIKLEVTVFSNNVALGQDSLDILANGNIVHRELPPNSNLRTPNWCSLTYTYSTRISV